MNIKHLQGPYKHVFMNVEEIKEALDNMDQDTSFNTRPSQVKDEPSPTGLVTFKEKHMAYLMKHPKVNPEHYLSNLRAVIRIRP